MKNFDELDDERRDDVLKGSECMLTRLLDRSIDEDDRIEISIDELFGDNKTSAFDSDGNVYIRLEYQYKNREIVLRLRDYEVIRDEDFPVDLRAEMIDYLRSVEDIIIELAKMIGTDCSLREFLNVKVKLIDRRARLWEQLSFFDRNGFERGQLYYIHCFTADLDYDSSKLYRYSGLDFVAADGKRLDYSSILKAIERDDAPLSVFRVELDNEPTSEFDGEPTVERYNDIIIPRRKIERLLVEDKAIPIFTFDADEELQTILCLYRRELNDERIQICLKATVYRDGHEIISMPFIHLYAPQHSRYTRAELDDVDAFVAKFEDYLNRDDDHGWATYPMADEINEFLINFGRLDKITRIKVEEAAQ